MSDSFTLDIIEAGLSAAADEMFGVIKKTAMSPIIYEILDVGTGLTDAKGRLISSGAGIPSFVGVLDKAVQAILARHPEPCDGDIYVTNDPYYGGVTHLNDVVICQPVFVKGRLCAWTASIAHWSDIGGRTPGSMSVKAGEIYQEGLRLPAVKLLDKGAPVAGLMDIITVNSRMPDFAKGDLWAQIAAGRKTATRIADLVAKYGMKAYEAAIARAFAISEARVRAGLKTFPKGRYDITGLQDNGESWNIAIEITDEKFVVDLRNTPAQSAGPFNTSRDGAVIAAQMAFKTACDPERMANHGSYIPLEVLTKPGTIFEAIEPAAHGYYFETRIALFDLIWQCLARANPDAIPAGHFASICGTVIAGTNPWTGKRYTMVEPQQGGWGASKGRRGQSALYSASHGETFNCPVEIAEARYGFTICTKSLGQAAPESKNFEGGRGVKIVYEMQDQAVISMGYTHAKIPVWSVTGAQGGHNLAFVERSGAACEDVSIASDVTLNKGDKLIIETAFGGGS